MVSHFEALFKSALDENSRAMMAYMAAQRWISLRIQLIGAMVVLFTSMYAVVFRNNIDAGDGIVAILLIWSSNFVITLGFLVRAISDSEAEITSVERMSNLLSVPQESDVLTSKSHLPAEDWPQQGALTFENVRLRYMEGLPLVLNGLTFELKPRQRCGVVGRTGAGKSTLTYALFRLAEIESGTIRLDGVDLSTLGLADVRGRKNGMCIIPQDPVLFAGSLRDCVDPFGTFTDDNVLNALRAVKIASADVRGEEVL